MIKECERTVCAKPFEPKRATARYCSDGCRAAASRERRAPRRTTATPPPLQKPSTVHRDDVEVAALRADLVHVMERVSDLADAVARVTEVLESSSGATDQVRVEELAEDVLELGKALGGLNTRVRRVEERAGDGERKPERIRSAHADTVDVGPRLKWLEAKIREVAGAQVRQGDRIGACEEGVAQVAGLIEQLV